MHILKSCEKKYNIKGYKSIRVGTLYGFRYLENLELRAEQEGIFDFEIDIKKSEIPIEVFLYLYCGVFSGRNLNYPYNCLSTPPNIKSATGHVQCGKYDFYDNHVLVENSSIRMKSLHHNCFVFCASLEESLPKKSKFKGYDDFWYFEFDKVEIFSEKIANEIRMMILDRRYLIDLENFNPEKISIRKSYREIIYAPKFISDREINFTSLSKVIQSLEKITFTKPVYFKKDKEFRFQFEVFYDGKPLSIPLEPIDIKLDDYFITQILSVQ